MVHTRTGWHHTRTLAMPREAHLDLTGYLDAPTHQPHPVGRPVMRQVLTAWTHAANDLLADLAHYGEHLRRDDLTVICRMIKPGQPTQ